MQSIFLNRIHFRMKFHVTISQRGNLSDVKGIVRFELASKTTIALSHQFFCRRKSNKVCRKKRVDARGCAGYPIDARLTIEMKRRWRERSMPLRVDTERMRVVKMLVDREKHYMTRQRTRRTYIYGKTSKKKTDKEEGENRDELERERDVTVINEARRFLPPNDSRWGNAALLRERDK